jgi:hypothetical protein
MINRQTMKLLRADIDAALVEVANKHQVLLSTGSATFSDTAATFKLNVAIADAATVASVAAGNVSAKHAKAASDFIKSAKLYGLDPLWLNTTVRINGSMMEIIGLLPHKHKNVVLIRGTGGGEYICSAQQVINGR